MQAQTRSSGATSTGPQWRTWSPQASSTLGALLWMPRPGRCTGPTGMYWTDPAAGKIQRARLDGTAVEDLVTSDLSNPRGIALVPALQSTRTPRAPTLRRARRRIATGTASTRTATPTRLRGVLSQRCSHAMATVSPKAATTTTAARRIVPSLQTARASKRDGDRFNEDGDADNGCEAWCPVVSVGAYATGTLRHLHVTQPALRHARAGDRSRPGRRGGGPIPEPPPVAGPGPATGRGGGARRNDDR